MVNGTKKSLSIKHRNYSESPAPFRSGRYTLVVSLPKKKWIRIGSLGKRCFPQGTYLYTGSAMNSLWGRLSRHLTKRAKRNHWHIDYLLQCPEAHVKEVLIYAPTWQECDLNQRIARLAGAQTIMEGFGSSDCSFGCPAHLYYFPQAKIPALVTKDTGHVRVLFNTPQRGVAPGQSAVFYNQEGAPGEGVIKGWRARKRN